MTMNEKQDVVIIIHPVGEINSTGDVINIAVQFTNQTKREVVVFYLFPAEMTLTVYSFI